MISTETPSRASPLDQMRRVRERAQVSSLIGTSARRRWLAVLRLATGLLFAGAFVARAFSPSNPSGLDLVRPDDRLTPFFVGVTSPLSEAVLTSAMVGVGFAVMLGIGLRVSAVVGAGVMLTLCLADWSFDGSAAFATWPVDSRIVFALALIVIAALDAGDTWGLGGRWKAWRVVQRNHWLI